MGDEQLVAQKDLLRAVTYREPELWSGSLGGNTWENATQSPKAFWISEAIAVVRDCILASDSASTITLASASVPE